MTRKFVKRSKFLAPLHAKERKQQTKAASKQGCHSVGSHVCKPEVFTLVIREKQFGLKSYTIGSENNPLETCFTDVPYIYTGK